MTKLVQKTISIPCNTKFLDEVRVLLRESLVNLTLPDREKELLILAVDEAVSSIVQYTQDKGITNEVSVTVDINDVRFKATIIDSCNVFDIDNTLTEKQITDKINYEKKYKLGIFLMRMIMDEITYTYKKGFENELVLIKFL